MGQGEGPRGEDLQLSTGSKGLPAQLAGPACLPAPPRLREDSVGGLGGGAWCQRTPVHHGGWSLAAGALAATTQVRRHPAP